METLHKYKYFGELIKICQIYFIHKNYFEENRITFFYLVYV